MRTIVNNNIRQQFARLVQQGKLTAREASKLANSRNIDRVLAVIQARQSRLSQQTDVPPVKHWMPPTVWIDPKTKELPTPEWFQFSGKADVSIIVPLYKSVKVLDDQVKSWDLYTDDGLQKEVIYIDDCCPQETYRYVIDAWEKRRKQLKGPLGRIFVNSHNVGYGHTCNTAAKLAQGEFLIFLNADTQVTPNWVFPMYDRMKSDPTIGILGNMHLKVIDGQITIDSSGSEWVAEKSCFEHVGRHSYLGKPIMKPFRFNNVPPDILTPGDREMVTGACFMIRADLFQSIGGYDPNYRIGYWEDSEMNMSIRELGYRVFYEPTSHIFHDVGHSNSGRHPFMESNRLYFFNRWVYNGRLDKYVHTSVPKRQLNRVFLKRSAANGDVLVAASVAAAIKKLTPNCSITFATKCPEMLLKHPYIDCVETLSEEQGIVTSVDGFDATYDLDNAYELFPKKHMLDAYANRAGVLREDCKICLTCEPIFDIKLPADYIVIHPGRTSWVGRHWDAKHFNEIARRLRKLGHFVVLIGSKEGADALPAANLDIRGITTIPQLGTVIRGAKFFVGIDSLPMWIAQTFDIPGLCFFGCVDPETRLIGKMQAIQQTGISCLGCHNNQPIPCVGTSTCPYGQPVCERLTVDQFWQALMENPYF